MYRKQSPFRVFLAAWLTLFVLTLARGQQTTLPTGNGGITADGAQDDAFVWRRTNSTYGHRYGFRLEVNSNFTWTGTPVTNLTEYWPQDVVRFAGKTYYAATHIYPFQTSYPSFNSGTNYVYPQPGVYNQWVVFNEDGAAGATGANGSNGAPGAGNANIGPWLAATGYSRTNAIVAYSNAFWMSFLGSTNVVPGTDTNYWFPLTTAPSNGANGYLLGTNLVYRGAWVSGQYCSNEYVSYLGSLYLVTNKCSGDTPGGTNWLLYVSKGDTGNTGPAGADGAVTYYTNVLQYIQSWTNSVWTNNPATNLPCLYFDHYAGTTAYYYWAACPTSSSSGSGSVNFTSTWGVATTAGTTNPAVMIPMGASNTVLGSTCATCSPAFYTLQQLGGATGTPIYSVSGLATGTPLYGAGSITTATNGIEVTNGAVVLNGPSNAASGFIQFPDGTKQYSAGVGGTTTVTNLPSNLVTGGNVTTNAGPTFTLPSYSAFGIMSALAFRTNGIVYTNGVWSVVDNDMETDPYGIYDITNDCITGLTTTGTLYALTYIAHNSALGADLAPYINGLLWTNQIPNSPPFRRTGYVPPSSFEIDVIWFVIPVLTANSTNRYQVRYNPLTTDANVVGEASGWRHNCDFIFVPGGLVK